jgi:hypothetical protein
MIDAIISALLFFFVVTGGMVWIATLIFLIIYVLTNEGNRND